MKKMAIRPVLVVLGAFCLSGNRKQLNSLQNEKKLFNNKLFVISGLQSKHVTTQDDLIVLIDFNKYQLLRHDKLVISSNKTSAGLCAETEQYRKCGNKCVLSCRYASSPSEIATSKKDCDKTECIEGCFCKEGFVRYQEKCIPAKDCPIRSNKAIEDETELEDSNSLEKRVIKPGCSGSDCSCSGNGCTSSSKPTKPSSSCKPPGCNTGSISIVNHNQAISHISGRN